MADITEKYHAFLGIEFEADTVKKVRINTKEKAKDSTKEVFVIPLIDHKSDVDYDVSMQLLRYTVVIWYDYRKTHEFEHKNKGFRYPLIVPIVYYEGEEQWTVDRKLLNRIEYTEGMEKYIPKFEYKVISGHGYTEEELRKKHDQMSLLRKMNTPTKEAQEAVENLEAGEVGKLVTKHIRQEMICEFM